MEAREVPVVDFMTVTPLGQDPQQPALLGRKTPIEKVARFSQDLGEQRLFRMKLAPIKRKQMFSYQALQRFGRRVENTRMESTFHPCMYTPNGPIEYRPWLTHVVRGTLVQERERHLEEEEEAEARMRAEEERRKAQTLHLKRRPATHFGQRPSNLKGMTI